jgi:hypothetical protein
VAIVPGSDGCPWPARASIRGLGQTERKGQTGARRLSMARSSFINDIDMTNLQHAAPPLPAELKAKLHLIHEEVMWPAWCDRGNGTRVGYDEV